MSASKLSPGEWLFLSLLGLVAACNFTGCSSAVELTSAPRVQEIKIDGQSREWRGMLKAVEDEDLSIGVQNDADNLYLCLQAADRETGRRLIVGGMTIWFDHLGGTPQRWGIHFPLGLAGTRRIEDRSPAPGTEGQPARSGAGGQGRPSLNELEIIGPGSDEATRVELLTSEREYGIQAGLSDVEGTLVYELKVPIASRTGRFALGSIPGKLLKIDIESQKTTSRSSGTDYTAGGGLPTSGGRRGRGGGGAQLPGDQTTTSGSSLLSLRVHLQ